MEQEELDKNLLEVEGPSNVPLPSVPSTSLPARPGTIIRRRWACLHFTVILVRSLGVYLVPKGEGLFNFVEMMLKRIGTPGKACWLCPSCGGSSGMAGELWLVPVLLEWEGDSLGQSEWVSWLLFITGIVHDLIRWPPGGGLGSCFRWSPFADNGSRSCSSDARSLRNGRLFIVIIIYWVRCLGNILSLEWKIWLFLQCLPVHFF